jgi:hypothetical protein
MREPELPLKAKRPKMTSEDETPTRELAVRGEEPSILALLDRALAGGVTPEKVAIAERLCDLKLKVDAIEAEKAFAAAFNELLRDMPQIEATKGVPNNDGSVRYRFTPIEEIDAQLRPVALKHGFSFWFEEGEIREDRITETCVVQHISGHKRATPYTVRISAPPKATLTQADGSTHTYAKRNALCSAFAIIVRHVDDDARLVGSNSITEDQAVELRQRVRELDIDQATFLQYCQAKDFESIPSEKYDRLCQLLDRKEQGKKPVSEGSLL